MKQKCTFQECLTDIKSTAALFYLPSSKQGILELSKKVLNAPPPQGAVKLCVIKVWVIRVHIQTPRFHKLQTMMMFNFTAPWGGGACGTTFESSDMPLLDFWKKKCAESILISRRTPKESHCFTE